MLNIVTSKVNDPHAVLIRGLDAVSGPGRLTKYLGIDKNFYGLDVTVSKTLYLTKVPKNLGTKEPEIKATPRIGIDCAGSGKINH